MIVEVCKEENNYPKATKTFPALQPKHLANLRFHFADFPYKLFTVDQSLFNLGTCCGLWYDRRICIRLAPSFKVEWSPARRRATRHGGIATKLEGIKMTPLFISKKRILESISFLLPSSSIYHRKKTGASVDHQGVEALFVYKNFFL